MDNKKIGDMIFDKIKKFISNESLDFNFVDERNDKWSWYYRFDLLQIFFNGDVFITIPINNENISFNGMIVCYIKSDDLYNIKEIKKQLLINLKNYFPYFLVKCIPVF